MEERIIDKGKEEYHLDNTNKKNKKQYIIMYEDQLG